MAIGGWSPPSTNTGTVSTADTGTTVDSLGIAHSVDLQTLMLRATNGEQVNLKGVFVDLSVTCSIFDHHVQGTLTIFDAVGLLNRVPIVGEEWLDIAFTTPGNSPKQGTFRIWKVSDEHPSRDGNESAYVLHFCSPELFWNAQQTVRRSFRNTDDAAAIVRTIVQEHLRSQKPITVTQMHDPAKCLVIPAYRPFDAIDMLLRRGYSGNKSKSDYFLFFERWDGYQLKMFDDLVSSPINKRLEQQGQSPAPGGGVPNPSQPGATPDTPPQQGIETWYVYASDKYQTDSVEGRDIRRVLTLQIHQRFDTLKKLSQGLYDNETVYYSIVNKSLESRVFKHEQDGILFLGGSPDPFRSTGKVGGAGNERTNSQAFVSEFDTPRSPYAWESSGKSFTRLRHEEEKDGVDKKAGGLYWSLRQALDQLTVTITVPGDSMVDVGDVVHLEIPRFDSVTGKVESDKFLHGKWVVGGLTDSILAPSKHVMIIDLYRDAYWHRPAEADFSTSQGTQAV